MKSRKCKQCRTQFLPPSRGRRPRYCSAACRQKAYRKRETNPHRAVLRVLASDLYAIKDLTARSRAAVKVLNEMGYEVWLEKRSSPSPKKYVPRLRVVDSSKGKDD